MHQNLPTGLDKKFAQYIPKISLGENTLIHQGGRRLIAKAVRVCLYLSTINHAGKKRDDFIVMRMHLG